MAVKQTPLINTPVFLEGLDMVCISASICEMKFDTICEILLYLINSTLFAKLFPFVKFEPIFETVQFLCNSALFAKLYTISKEETSLVQWDGISI